MKTVMPIDHHAQHIISFSGGKDSTAMLFMMLERGMPVDRIINVDTTKEFPAMYRHIQEVQKRIAIKIEIIQIDFDYWFGEHIKTRGKRAGTTGYGWPDFRNRWCTALKRQAFSSAISDKSHSFHKHGLTAIEYHGIAADEPARLNKNPGRNIRYPLAEWGITEKEALAYCYSLGFDWSGLYEEGRSRVSCFCCPLQRLGELRLTFNNHPELWSIMEEMDKTSFRDFRSDYDLSTLTCKFAKER